LELEELRQLLAMYDPLAVIHGDFDAFLVVISDESNV
jgi:hypothetical protein